MFYYNAENLSDMLSTITKNIDQMSNMEDGYLNKMESISKSGLYGNGIEMIDSQIVSIKDGLTDFKNLTNSNARAVEDTEKRLKNDVSKISLPKNFDADDVGIVVETSGLTLSKDNGLAVNANASVKEEKLEDNYDVESLSIKNLVKDSLENSNLDDYIKSKQININNINEGSVNTSEMEDLKESKEINLNNIRKEKDLENNLLDDYKETEKKEIFKMSNGADIIKNSHADLDYDDYLIQKYSVLEKGLLDMVTRGDNDDHKS